jgi:UDP-glucose 4-epimerase
MGLSPQQRYTGRERSWMGDSPIIFLDTQKVRSLGWASRRTIGEAVISTLDYLRENERLLRARRAA